MKFSCALSGCTSNLTLQPAMPSLSKTSTFSQKRKASAYNRTVRSQRSRAVLSLNRTGNRRINVFRALKVCRFTLQKNALHSKSIFKQTRNALNVNSVSLRDRKEELAVALRHYTTKNLDSQISLPLKNSGSASNVVCNITIFHPLDTSLLGDNFNQCGSNEHLMDSQTLERFQIPMIK